MTKTHRKGRQGFTLIELMIVVAIIGILAAIAIPNFLRFQLKSKTTEGKVNLAAIRTAEETYLAEFGQYVPAASLPGAVGVPPGTAKDPWPAAAPGFDTIGWGPEGDVFFNYAVDVDAVFTGYTATAEADLDGNGTPQAWGYAKPDAAGARVPATAGSCAVGDLAAVTQVGPCDAGSGNPVYGQSEF